MCARDQIFGLGRLVCSDEGIDIGTPLGILHKVDIAAVSPAGTGLLL